MYKIYLILILFSFSANAQEKKDIDVVVSIKPIHSIVSNLMHGIASPKLLLQNNESPHNFHIKPSQAIMLNNADLIIYIDEEFEFALANILKNYNNSSKLIISELNFDKKHSIREFDTNHNNKNHEDHENHESHESHEGHKSEIDYHFWLNIDNIRYIAKKINNKLIKIDKDNADLYVNNLKELDKKLIELDKNITAKMSLLTEKEFINFSDTLQYFENKYNLKEAIIINYHHGSKPSIKKILATKKHIQEKQIKCLFYSSEENDKQIKTITENNSINTKEINILGNDINSGPKQYFQLMQNIAVKIQECLK